MCPYLSECPFFAGFMAEMPNGAAKYQREYCLDENKRCARYILLEALGESHVPRTLFPNQYDEMIQILRRNLK